MKANAVPHLSAEVFNAIREFIHSVAGISLADEKQELVKSRLAARLRELKLDRYEQYLERIATDGAERSHMVDALTTNKTSFFREEQHFEYLISTLVPLWREEARPLQIWSAGCSTGEEPYTVAMLLCHYLAGHPSRILATDLSNRVLVQGKAGSYSAESVEAIPAWLRAKYVQRQGHGSSAYEVTPEIRQCVSFARLNLAGDWPMRGPFDLILCRNVMIYFRNELRTQLAQRFAELLAPGAHLFIGHAESLNGLDHPFGLVRPSIYQAPWRSFGP
jgi:chemotaxis protein methyltransferase CheR